MIIDSTLKILKSIWQLILTKHGTLSKHKTWQYHTLYIQIITLKIIILSISHVMNLGIDDTTHLTYHPCLWGRQAYKIFIKYKSSIIKLIIQVWAYRNYYWSDHLTECLHCILPKSFPHKFFQSLLVTPIITFVLFLFSTFFPNLPQPLSLHPLRRLLTTFVLFLFPAFSSSLS